MRSGGTSRGWGSTGPDIALGLTWTQAECDNRFLDDLRSVGDRLTEIIGAASTSQDQFDAMLSLAYNAGPSIYHSSLMIYHREGRYEHAAAEFLQWDHQAGEVLPGLLRRREAEAAIYQGSSNHV